MDVLKSEAEGSPRSSDESRSVALEPHAVSRTTNAGLTMLFDRAKGVMYEMNESGSAIVALLSQEPQTVNELVDKLALEFEAPREELVEHVNAFVDDFLEAGLLTSGS